jgi:translation initiation factor eIF-2B subunit epsilon
MFSLRLTNYQSLSSDYYASDPSRSQDSMSVQVIASETFQSMGDALRELDTKAIIKSDFILINGDSIGNLPIKEIRAQHKSVLYSWLISHSTLNLFFHVSHNRKNRQKDKGCVMTTVFRRAEPYHKIRSIEDELVTVVDSETNKILHFERVYNNRRLQIPLVSKAIIFSRFITDLFSD